MFLKTETYVVVWPPSTGHHCNDNTGLIVYLAYKGNSCLSRCCGDRTSLYPNSVTWGWRNVAVDGWSYLSRWFSQGFLSVSLSHNAVQREMVMQHQTGHEGSLERGQRSPAYFYFGLQSLWPWLITFTPFGVFSPPSSLPRGSLPSEGGNLRGWITTSADLLITSWRYLGCGPDRDFCPR